MLVETVLAMLDPRRGERVLDLYAGVGLFAAFLADRLGADRVVAVEGHQRAARDAVANLPRGARVLRGDVRTVLQRGLDEPFDLVVLDPPREGARRPVVEQIVDRAPRAVAYVACDPAALARDVAIFAEHGYDLADLRAFDLFPMTHHVECVALLTKTGSDLRKHYAARRTSVIESGLLRTSRYSAAWFTRGYYGSVSHNVKAIYQRYLAGTSEPESFEGALDTL